jgi:hypothetical protein
MERLSHALRRGLPRRNAVSRALIALETGFGNGPNLWGKLMGGLSTAEKTAYARALGVPRDYDDWWHYRQYWRDDLPLRTRLQFLDFHTFMPGLVLTKVDRNILPDHILDRRKKGFGIPRYYLKDLSEGKAIQEHVLQRFLRADGNH